MTYHNPALLQSVLHYLDVQPGGLYVDATLGGGGHAKAIIGQGGKVLGLDQDQDAIDENNNQTGLTPVKINFIHLEQVVKAHHWQPLSGILFDFGVSSHQINTSGRGFSFQNTGPLDMRMDQQSPVSAQILVNQLSVKQLTSLLADFGEIPVAKSVSEKIVNNRPFTTTHQLAAVVGPHWSRQVFQAFRIAVNDELTAITQGLDQAAKVICPKGRLVTISFQSLEDRIVKDFFNDQEKQGTGKILTRKPVVPTPQEQSQNPRSKSAKLRALEII